MSTTRSTFAELDTQAGPDWSQLNEHDRQLAQLEPYGSNGTALAALRERYLRPIRIRLFAEVDAYDTYMLQRLTLNSREDLTGAAREQALEALEKTHAPRRFRNSAVKRHFLATSMTRRARCRPRGCQHVRGI